MLKGFFLSLVLLAAFAISAQAQNLPPTMTSGGAGSGAVAQPGGAYSISPLTHTPGGNPQLIQLGTLAFGSLPTCTAALGGSLVYVTAVTAGVEGATCAGAGTATQLAFCNGALALWKCF